jgi:FkbM family methyltransferase
MSSSLSIKLGNFLYKTSFPLYKKMYSVFKNKQDAFEIELLKKHIKPGDTVLDIGANIGFYATILSDIAGEKGKIHCFEPDATNFNHLKKTTCNYKNIVINNKAVGPRTEKIRIYTSKELNVDHRTYKPEEYDQEIEIDAVSIDDYLKGEKVQFIKMDIQGFEMEAMKGMKETLKNNPDVKMISEFWPYGLKKAGSSLRDYFILLKELNFKVEILKDNTLEILKLETVLEMESLPQENYFNILVTPNV